MAALSLSHREFRSKMRAAFFLALAGMLLLVACSKSLKVNDPQLKPIQDMLETNLPTGSSEDAVSRFLAMRGYSREAPTKTGTIVAVIRHIDTEKLQPVTARVTFYFDANGRLNTMEIVRTMNAPIPQ
jgi:hypothetical protein